MEDIRYAGLFRRITACLIDYMLIMILPIILLSFPAALFSLPNILLHIIEASNHFTFASYIPEILLLFLNAFLLVSSIFLLVSSIFLVKSQFKLWNELQISRFYRIFNIIIMMLIFVPLFFSLIVYLYWGLICICRNSLGFNEFIDPDMHFLALIWLCLGLFYYFCYVPLREGSERQGSFGYQVMGIKIIDKYNKKIVFTRSLARYIIFLLGAMLWVPHIINFFTILCSKEKKGIHDALARTRVIRN